MNIFTLPFFLKKTPIIRKLIYSYLKNWTRKNPTSEVISTIEHGLKMKLSVNDWVQNNLLMNGYYEKNESDYWVQKCKNAITVIDIGANVGYFSLLAAKSVESEKAIVHAFEPVTKTFTRLKENISLNALSSIKAHQIAISNTNDSIRINVGNDENWGMSSINTHEHLSGNSETVQCMTLDSFCDLHKIEKIDVIKIDVEGAEYRVLKGMEKTLLQSKPEVLIEVIEKHLNKDSSNAAEVYDFFWSKGYQSFIIRENKKLEPINKAISHEGLVCFKFIN